MDNIKSITRRPAATIALISSKARHFGELRSQDVQNRVREAMKCIEAEINENNGVYPHKKRKISLAYVATRAEISPSTFYTVKQRDLGEEVKSWIINLYSSQNSASKISRLSLADRLKEWKILYEGLLQAHRDTELELRNTESDLEIAKSHIKDLKDENQRLLTLPNKLASSQTHFLRIVDPSE